MSNYSGNREAFLFVYLAKADDAAGRAAVDALERAGYRLYLAQSFAAKDARALNKAAAAVLLMSSATLNELSPVVSAATKEDKPLIPVYLDRVELPAGMRMLLGPKQAHARQNYTDDAGFAEALLASPVLRELRVTPAQKKAARGLLIGAVAAAVVIVAAVLLLTLGRGGEAKKIDDDSTLSQIGLAGNVSDVRSVCYYGAELRDAFEPYGAQRTEGSDGSIEIYLPRLDETVAQGMLTDASDFSQLLNLEELAISGNRVSDITPSLQLSKLKRLDLSANLKPVSLAGIGALESLEFLNLAYCRIDGDLSELAALPHLRRLIISQDSQPLVEALGDVGFEVLYTEAAVSDWPALKAASETEYVYTIELTGGELVIPAGETLTIRKNVLLKAEYADARRLINRGTIALNGTSRLRIPVENQGPVVVGPACDWHGVGSEVISRGSFTVAEGGAHTLTLGLVFRLVDGEYVNNGTLYVTGGSFDWAGGRFVNNGVIYVNEVLPDGTVPLFNGELSEAEGEGEVRTGDGSAVDREALQKSKAQLSEEIAALLAMEDDPGDLDQYGMTPKERALYDYARSLDFLDFGTMQENLLPIVDTDRLDILQTPRNGSAFLARDMTLFRAPDCWYKEGGVWAFVVAPGVTVTVDAAAADWERHTPNPGDGPDDIWFTVMEGGRLVVNGEMPYNLAVNHGELIVNGRLCPSAPQSQFGDLLGMAANDGSITVAEGGTFIVNQLWSFAGARERGEITFDTTDGDESRRDFTEHDCPFSFEHGKHGFSSFFKYMLDPEGIHDIFTEKFWDW